MVSINNIKNIDLGNKPKSRGKMTKELEAQNVKKKNKMAYL